MMLGLTFVQLLMLAVIVIGACIVFSIFLRRFGVAIPPWMMELVWVVVAVVLVLFAIRIIAGLF